MKQLDAFFNKAQQVNCFLPSHICLYLCLFRRWQQQQFQNPLYVSRALLMRHSKISSKTTYHKCLNDLCLYGFIRYHPSYHPAVQSSVFLIDLTLSDTECTSMFNYSEPL